MLRGEAEAASVFPNATDIGTSREKVYAEMLRTHVPSGCNVLFGGFVFDQQGHESKQIDVIVTDHLSLQFNFLNPDGSGKSFACVDGCVAVASIKSCLDSNNLVDCLDNLATIPSALPLEKRANPLIKISEAAFADWPVKIVYASSGVKSQTLLDTLNRYYQEKTIPVTKRPNIIHVLGQGSIARVRKGATTIDGRSLKEDSFYFQDDPTDVYSLLATVMAVQKVASAMRHVNTSYQHLLKNMLISPGPGSAD